MADEIQYYLTYSWYEFAFAVSNFNILSNMLHIHGMNYNMLWQYYLTYSWYEFAYAVSNFNIFSIMLHIHGMNCPCSSKIILHIHGMNLHILSATSIFCQTILGYIFMV